jgi:hypothetical protein
MGYVFSGDGRRVFHMSEDEWQAVVRLARNHGWEPYGTDKNGSEELVGAPDEWNGSYFSKCGQGVMPDDAYALGRAISSALKGERSVQLGECCEDCTAFVLNPVRRVRLAQFAKFCMATGFYIS